MYASFDFTRRIVPATSSAFVVPAVTDYAQAFLDRTTGLDSTHQNAYRALINGLAADGVWTKFDFLYIFATADQTTALLNLVSTSYTAITHGTVNFTADRGYTGDGSTFYITNGYIPGLGINYTRNSASAGFYNLTSDTSITLSTIFREDAVNFDIFLVQQGTGHTSAYITSGGADPSHLTSTTTDNQGQYIASRTSSVQADLYVNGSSTPDNSLSSWNSAALGGSTPLYIFSNSGIAGFLLDEISTVWMAGGLTASEAASVAARINTYMTTFSINVY